ncbi:MAG: class I SAM-dependent methyltransferase [Rhodocyclaceae bacterium]|nr:class I SAM-dependent methyltransferase [Rhodocyclaceae bacterium]
MSQEFWDFYASVAEKLLQREVSFRRMFEHLDRIEASVVIVETGCVRNPDPWAMTGEGQSTLLFDKYVNARGDDSRAYSVDISADAVRVCRSLVSNKVEVHQGDSVGYLNQLTRRLLGQGQRIDLFYLDSFDVDYNYWFPSAAHHLKELVAAWRCVGPNTLVVVDDCPVSANLVADEQGSYQLDRFYRPVVGGKGRLVAEFADQVGARLAFSHYQHGWTGF